MREEKTSIGAIRWDAWYGHNEREEDTCPQVENTLSPAKYHFRAPFYGYVNEEGKIRFPDYSLKTFDREAEYAIEAGIDYFCYVWYTHPGLRLARDMHLKSKYRNKIKMCACLDNNALGKKECREEICGLLKEDHYKKVLNGRPLFYYYRTGENYDKIGEDAKFYREYCEKNGIPEPYNVIFGGWPEPSKQAGMHALSRYAVTATGGLSFEEYNKRVENVWEHHYEEAIKYQMDNVPPLSFGWHNGTRYDTKVTWLNVSADAYAEYATSEQLARQTEDVIKFLADPRNADTTPANTAIIYAWNEHDEGGWLCPTIAVDENGNQIFDENGDPLIDDSRVKAVGKVIKSLVK